MLNLATLYAVIRHVKGISSGHSKRFLGHNPLGSLMVIALLITLLTIVLCGMKLYAIEEGKGPFSVFPNEQTNAVQPIENRDYQNTDYGDDNDEELEGEHERKRHSHEEESEEEEFWEERHELAINFML